MIGRRPFLATGAGVSFILDVALVIVPIMLAFLGFGRGIQREATSLIGILLGALLADIWAPIWGPGNAAQFNQDPLMMQAIIADLLLIGSTIFIGYGGALLLPSRRQIAKGPGRFYGALAGGLNGLLIEGLLLRYASLAAGAGFVPANVAATRLGPLLSTQFARLLLLGTCIGGMIVLVRLLQRLLGKIHGKSAPTPPKPALKPVPKPVVPAEKPAPKQPVPVTTSNALLQDLLESDPKKSSS